MKKQLLFLITLLLEITPACKQKNKPNLAGPNGAIAAGTILAGGGIATTIATGAMIATAPSGAALAAAGMGALVHTIPIVALLSVTPALLIMGIPILIYGIKKRKAKIRRFKEQQKLEIAIQEKQADEENLSRKD